MDALLCQLSERDWSSAIKGFKMIPWLVFPCCPWPYLHNQGLPSATEEMQSETAEFMEQGAIDLPLQILVWC
jgi:hypothetical protein